MRSYYSHLESAQVAKTQPIPPKSIFRSSAIFPVQHRSGISSRVLFLGYWLLKRNIQHIATVVTLRAASGELLQRQNFAIQEAKSYIIELSKFLENIGWNEEDPFLGTLEVEFFSNTHLVFPYPAVTVNYYGPAFSCVVHTAQRVYNDFEDLRNNTQKEVPEAGFNLFADAENEPFISFINGPEAVVESPFDLQFFNTAGETLLLNLQLGPLAPYELKVLHPARLIDLRNFLQGQVGTAKVRFHAHWVFPRLLVGNIQHALPSLTITHSYYDCSAATSDSDYWLEPRAEWYQAALMVPAYLYDQWFTSITFYPLYSPTMLVIDLELYDASGKQVIRKEEALKIDAPGAGLKRLELRTLCQEMGFIPTTPLAARLIARTPNGSRIPARIKIGLDIGKVPHPERACNICTNLQPFNPAVEGKPTTFRWAPLLADQPHAWLWMMNSSPAVDFKHEASLALTFFRSQDNATLQRTVTVPPHGFVWMRPEEDPELKLFFDGQVGWCTVISSNPYTTTYYFAENPSDVVGGDHGY